MTNTCCFNCYIFYAWHSTVSKKVLHRIMHSRCAGSHTDIEIRGFFRLDKKESKVSICTEMKNLTFCHLECPAGGRWDACVAEAAGEQLRWPAERLVVLTATFEPLSKDDIWRRCRIFVCLNQSLATVLHILFEEMYVWTSNERKHAFTTFLLVVVIADCVLFGLG
jgi:hypothetical protein